MFHFKNTLMKFKSLLLPFCLLLATPFFFLPQAGAQSLHFCKTHPTTGVPENTANGFNFSNSNAGFIYVLFNAESPIQGKLLLKVEKMDGEQFRPYEAYPLEAAGNAWAGIDFACKDEGDYRFSVSDGQHTLASDFASIKLNAEVDQFEDVNTLEATDSDTTTATTHEDYFSNDQSTMFYIDSKVKICTDESNTSEPKGEQDDFNYKKSGSKLFVWVNNAGHGIHADKIKVYTDFKKEEGKDTENENTTTYPVVNGNDTYCFKYKFTKKGIYTVRVYALANDGTEIWINDGVATFK